jgi:hypothetical protein
MELKEDERVQISKRIAVRYTYAFEIILIILLGMVAFMNKNLILVPPLYLFNTQIYISIVLSPLLFFIATTQMLVTFAAQALINKRLGGTMQPIVSENAKFRFMDERERIIADKSCLITIIYTNSFLIIWNIIDVFISGRLGLPLILVTLSIIFYSIVKGIILNGLGEKLS